MGKNHVQHYRCAKFDSNILYATINLGLKNHLLTPARKVTQCSLMIHEPLLRLNNGHMPNPKCCIQRDLNPYLKPHPQNLKCFGPHSRFNCHNWVKHNLHRFEHLIYTEV